MSKPTESELAFERLLTQLDLPWSRIPTDMNPTADYRISFATQEVIGEIKQIEPNDEDNAHWAEAQRRGVSGQWAAPGERVLVGIRDVRKQFKPYPGMPTMWIVNDRGTFAGTDSTDIQVVIEDEFRINRNTRISAIALFKDDLQRLLVYQNPHAQVSIDPIRCAGISFFVATNLSRAGWGWKLSDR